MKTVERVRAIYREGGIAGLTEGGRRRVRKLRREPEYQEKVPSDGERWAMIDEAIPAGTATALDLGSNLGDVTALCARRGIWTVGMESSPELVVKAARRHRAVPGCGFMTARVGPELAERLPRVDVILALSVYHHWHRAHGADGAEDLLRTLAANCEVLIFEGPSRQWRFGKRPPDFVDNDEASVTAYYDALLGRVASPNHEVRLLGRARCVGDREPYRWMYAIHR